MKKLVTALTAIALLAAGTATASAGTYAYASLGDCSALDGNASDWNTAGITDKLNSEGIAFESIGTFANCFRVQQTNTDGSTSYALYDPSTLNKIHL